MVTATPRVVSNVKAKKYLQADPLVMQLAREMLAVSRHADT